MQKSNNKKYSLKRIMLYVKDYLSIDGARKVIDLKIAGVPFKIALYSTFINKRYIDPRVLEATMNVDEVLAREYPSIKFCNEYNSTYVVDKAKNKPIKENGYGGYVSADSISAFIMEDASNERTVTHERIHQLLIHGNYSGPQNQITGEGKALNEGFVEWLNVKHFNGTGSYIETLYFDIFKNIFSTEEMLKMSTEGKSTENWKKSFSQFTDIDVLKLLDDNFSSKRDFKEVLRSFNTVSKELITVYFDYLKQKIKTCLMKNKATDSLRTVEEIKKITSLSIEEMSNSIAYLDSLYTVETKDKLLNEIILEHYKNDLRLFIEEINKLCSNILILEKSYSSEQEVPKVI
jgi:hypothetical protein